MYKYTIPSKRGYVLTSLSKCDLQKVFTRRVFKWYIKVEVWHKETNNTFLIEETKNIYYVILVTFLLPFACFYSLKDTKEILEEYASLFSQKEKGKHRSDTTHKDSEVNQKLHDIAMKKHIKRKIFQ